MFTELPLHRDRYHDEQFVFERVMLALLWLVSLVALFGYSIDPQRNHCQSRGRDRCTVKL